MLTGLRPLGIFEIVLIMTVTQLARQLHACLHLALLRHADRFSQCPLLGEERKCFSTWPKRRY